MFQDQVSTVTPQASTRKFLNFLPFLVKMASASRETPGLAAQAQHSLRYMAEFREKTISIKSEIEGLSPYTKVLMNQHQFLNLSFEIYSLPFKMLIQVYGESVFNLLNCVWGQALNPLFPFYAAPIKTATVHTHNLLFTN